MGFLSKETVTDISSKIVTKTFTTNENETIKVSILDAKYGKLKGKEILLDETLVNNMLDGIYKSVTSNNSSYNKIPKSIILSQNEDLLKILKSKQSLENNKNFKEDMQKQEIVDVYEPKYNFNDIYIKEDAKKQILSGMTMLQYKTKLFNEWGLKKSIKNSRALVFNFWGPPGTGKSMTAEAIAKYLGKKVFSVNYSQLESKYVGETPKNIKHIFEKATEEDAVLIFDEADSFLGKRLTNITQSADYGVNITRSVMLLELEKFEGVVIFTTNLITNYDEAFKRRILANIEFSLPDEEGRLKIWEAHIPKEFPLDENITFELLSKKYINISGADIKDITLFAAVNAIQEKRETVLEKDFDIAYKYIIGRYDTDKNRTNNQFQNLKIKTTEITEEEYLKEVEKGEA